MRSDMHALVDLGKHRAESTQADAEEDRTKSEPW